MPKGKFWYMFKDFEGIFEKNNKKADFDLSLQLLRFQCALKEHINGFEMKIL